MVAEHCRSVPVGEEVRAGPSIEGGTVFVRVRCRLRDNGDVNSELYMFLEAFVRVDRRAVGGGRAQ